VSLCEGCEYSYFPNDTIVQEVLLSIGFEEKGKTNWISNKKLRVKSLTNPVPCKARLSKGNLFKSKMD
jgi:hypothetical protein